MGAWRELLAEASSLLKWSLSRRGNHIVMKEISEKSLDAFADASVTNQASALARFVMVLATISYAAAGRARPVASARMSLVATVTREEVQK